MRRCPSCGYENNDSDAVCQYCHAQLVPGQAAGPEPVQPAASTSYTTSNYSQPSYNQAPAQSTQSGNNNAMIALIVAIAGFFCCGIIGGPIAIFMGKKEMDYYKNNPTAPANNKGLATAAFIIGIADTVLWLIGIIGYIFVMVLAVATSGM